MAEETPQKEKKKIRWKVSKSKQHRQRLYPPNWNALRALVLQRDRGLCVECFKKGKKNVGEEVHHIRSVRSGGSHELNNLRLLCKDCHFKLRNDRIRGIWESKKCVHKKRYLLAKKKKNKSPIMEIPLCEEKVCIDKIPRFLMKLRIRNDSATTTH